jgi:hypothetical protein
MLESLIFIIFTYYLAANKDRSRKDQAMIMKFIAILCATVFGAQSAAADKPNKILIPYYGDVKSGNQSQIMRTEEFRIFADSEFKRLRELQLLFGNPSNGCQTIVQVDGFDEMCILIPLKIRDGEIAR